jgi:large subunit ribosomal protein L22
MPHYGYGYRGRADEALARAQQYNIDASYKNMSAVCASIRGMDSDTAVAYLEKAERGEVAVEFKKWNKKMGHRRELGGKKGRYPKKAAKYVLQVLKNAIANGDSKGFGGMRVIHASSTRQAIYPRMQAKGRQVRANYVTSRVEIVLSASQVKPAKKGEKKAEASAEVKNEVKKEAAAIKEMVAKKLEEKKAEPKTAEEKKPVGSTVTAKAEKTESKKEEKK